MAPEIAVSTSSLGNGADAFDVTVVRSSSPMRCALFAAGRGGSPTRHMGLLHAIANNGIDVFAPHFETLASAIPTKTELVERSRRLAVVMDTCCPPDLQVAGIGHSIGTVILLVLAGAEATALAGDCLSFVADRTFDRLVLLTPPTNFFSRPGSLAGVSAEIQAWAGGADTITPPAQTEFLKDALKEQVQIDVRLVESAGHFTFMNELPPHGADPHPDRNAFLKELGDEVSRFLLASR